MSEQLFKFRIRKPALLIVLSLACVSPIGWMTANSAMAIHDGESGLPETVTSNQNPPREEKLKAVFHYYLAGSGLWRQEAGPSSGEGNPVAYIKRYEWGPGRAMVFDDTYALMQDGSCKPWAHNVFVWDSKRNAVRGYIFHSAGVFGTADTQLRSEHETSAELNVTLPDGSEVRMQDIADRSDSKKVTITASRWDGKTWSQNPPVSWVRIEGDENPCKSTARP